MRLIVLMHAYVKRQKKRDIEPDRQTDRPTDGGQIDRPLHTSTIEHFGQRPVRVT